MKPNSLSNWCIENDKMQILDEWDLSNNPNLKIADVTYGSNKKVNWVCSKNKEHKWTTTIKSRTKGSRCPKCKTKKTKFMKSNITITHPEVMKSWDYSKNKIDPTHLTYGSEKLAHWVCHDDKTHSWMNTIASETMKKRNIKHPCPICSGRVLEVGLNDLASTHPEIAKSWDYFKNKLKPTEVTHGMNIHVWWICQNNSKHKWKTTINDRTGGTNCPYCAGKKVLIGYNDLASTHPEIAKSWDYTKNKLKPTEVTAGSNKIAHWICDKDKTHKWSESVVARRDRRWCPKCHNYGTSYPEQFLYICLSNKFKKVHHRYIKDGYEYDIFIEDIDLYIEYDGHYHHRILVDKTDYELEKENNIKNTNGNFIRFIGRNEGEIKMVGNKIYVNKGWLEKPITKAYKILIQHLNSKYNLKPDDKTPTNINEKVIISYDNILKLQSVGAMSPHLINEWDYKANLGLSPYNITYGTSKQVWWKCKNNPKHKWKARINNRTINNRGCPYCAGLKILIGDNDLATLHPELIKEWDYSKNKLKPTEVTAGSGKIINWICSKNETHKWKTAVNKRTSGRNCPYCAGRKIQKNPAINNCSKKPMVIQ